MREQTKKMNELLNEYKQLKEEIFGNNMFIIMGNSEKELRYNQLFQFFYPQFRTKGFINPMEVKNGN